MSPAKKPAKTGKTTLEYIGKRKAEKSFVLRMKRLAYDGEHVRYLVTPGHILICSNQDKSELLATGVFKEGPVEREVIEEIEAD